MIFRKIEFMKSAADKSGFIIPNKTMIAVCGKSNVGKSTFINTLAQINRLAKTSSTPGRTRLVNYFDFEHFILADLPGYGFAQVSKIEKDKWSKTLDDFFKSKEDIAHVFALVDIRHKPTVEDIQMLEYLYYHIIPFTIIATKSDKLGKSLIKPKIRELASYLKIGENDIIPFSSINRRGREDVLLKIEDIIKIDNKNFNDDIIKEQNQI